MPDHRTRKALLAWLPVVAWAAVIFFVSAQPKAAFERIGLTSELIALVGHFLTYAILMSLLVVAFRFGSRLPARIIYLVAFILVALYGLSDEYHQSFVPGRTATLVDWIVDLAGAAAAWFILARRARRHSQSTTRIS